MIEISYSGSRSDLMDYLLEIVAENEHSFAAVQKTKECKRSKSTEVIIEVLADYAYYAYAYQTNEENMFSVRLYKSKKFQ